MRKLSYWEQLRLGNLLTEPVIQQAIRAMRIRPGSVGLDAGCGIGQHTLWLAEETGPSGKVTGVDVSPENLSAARRAADERNLSGRVKFLQENLLHLPLEDSGFDWAWCANTLWPVPGMDPLAGVAELRRVVRCGGRIGLLFWSNQTLLPGYPLLEARLDLAHAANNPYLNEVPPHLHFLRALGWLRSAGLQQIEACTFVADAHAPLTVEIRDALAFCFSMFWGDLEVHLSPEDWREYRRLCDPESNECILDSPDYYCLLTYTLFHGKVAK
jgi:SAM-dependent methyltransferase